MLTTQPPLYLSSVIVRSKHDSRPSSVSTLLDTLHSIMFRANVIATKFIGLQHSRFPVRQGQSDWTEFAAQDTGRDTAARR